MEDIELIDYYVSDLTDLLQKLRHRYEGMEDSVSHEDFEKETFKHNAVESNLKIFIKNAKSLKIRVGKKERENEERIKKEEKEIAERSRKEKKKEKEKLRREQEEKEKRTRKEVAKQKVWKQLKM